MSLFGKDATSFSHLDLGILCHSSLQILSSSVRLDGKRWWTAIFRSLQRCSIGFFKNSHGVVVKPLLRNLLRTMWYFSFSFLINLQKCQQFCVFLSIWGAVCTLMRKKMNLNDFSKWLQYNKEWKMLGGLNTFRTHCTHTHNLKHVFLISGSTISCFISVLLHLG